MTYILGTPVFCFGAPRQAIQLNLETAKQRGRNNITEHPLHIDWELANLSWTAAKIQLKVNVDNIYVFKIQREGFVSKSIRKPAKALQNSCNLSPQTQHIAIPV